MLLSRYRALLAATVLGAGIIGGGTAAAAAPPSAAAATKGQRLLAEVARLEQKTQHRDAIPLAEQLLALRERALGSEHPDIAAATHLLADLCVKSSDLLRAEALYKRALDLRERALGPEHPDVAATLHGLADLYQQRWAFRRAEPLARRALGIREKAFGADSLDVAASGRLLGAILRGEEQFDLARQEFMTALATFERRRGAAHPDVAETLAALGQLDLEADRIQQAKERFERAIAIWDKALGEGSLASTESLIKLGWVYVLGEQDLERARSLMQRALAVRERALGDEHVLVALVRGELGWLCRISLDLDVAESSTIEALRVLKRVLDPADAVLLLKYQKNLIEIEQARGDFARMDEALERARQLAERAEDAPTALFTHYLTAAADALYTRSEYGRAESMIRRALELQEARLGREHRQTWFTRTRLANLFIATGNYAAAEAILLEDGRLIVARFGPQSSYAAGHHLALGFFYIIRGDGARAEAAFHSALEVTNQTGKRFSTSVKSFALSGLASAYMLGGRTRDARVQIERALALVRQVSPKDTAFTADLLATQARVLVADGDAAGAEVVARRVLEIRERAFGAEHPKVVGALNQLAKTVLAQGRTGEARELMQRAAGIQERHASLLLSAGSEEQRRAFLAKLRHDTDAAVSLHARLAPKDPLAARLALTIILRRKGRVIDAMSDTLAGLRRRLDPEDQRLLDQLRQVQRHLAMHYTRGAGSASAREVAARARALDEERQSIEAKIAARSPAFDRARRLTTLEEVQAAIPDGAALVEIVGYRPFQPRAPRPAAEWGAPRYAAYVLRRRGGIALADLGEAAPIDAVVQRLRVAISDPLQDPGPPARDLDARVMAPVRRLLGDARWIFMSPDGALNLIPFGALVDEQGRYLLESYSFTYLTSGRDLLRASAPAAPRQAPVIIADPDFGPIDGPFDADPRRGRRSADLAALRFPRMPLTADEGRDIRPLLPSARMLLGADATESALKAVRGPAVLHVATHGFFLPRQAKPPDAGLTPEAAQGAELQRENWLLRSGLAFAGANVRRSGDDDGLLTALEASGLDLDGTRLVTLSACETGVGEVSLGDGVYGLRRALSLAGAETQVMSLWLVDDEVTRQLMAGYYRALQAGAGRSEAMREVALSIRGNRETSHPYFWAGFIVSGNWRSLSGQTVVPDVGPVHRGPRGCACAQAGGGHEGGWGAWLAALVVLTRSGRRKRR